MTEDYLHYIWKYKLFNTQKSVTQNREEIEFIDFGFPNKDAGPDFSQAKIKIGNTTWVGNVEIHLNSSDWFAHKHHHDKAYDSVILHVVYNHDKEIKTSSGSVIPTLELKTLLDYTQFQEYKQFILDTIPCRNLLSEIPPVILFSTMDKMGIERISHKTSEVKTILEAHKYDWEQVFFQQLVSSLGLKVNSFPMKQLASQLDVKIFPKLGKDLLAVESILFGQAGFLEEERIGEDYYSKLRNEFLFYQEKYRLKPLKKESWKFAKMRPSNFPTLRLAQLARVLNQTPFLFTNFISKDITIKTIYSMLNCTIEEGFWCSHYTFEKESRNSNKSIGKTLINSVIINTISPFLYLYGEYKGQEIYKEKAIQLLEMLPPENNTITRLFTEKIPLQNAAESQGMIHCHNFYCLKKKCLDCSIGIHILKPKNEKQDL